MLSNRYLLIMSASAVDRLAQLLVAAEEQNMQRPGSLGLPQKLDHQTTLPALLIW